MDMQKSSKTSKTILTMGDNPKVSTGYGQVWDNLLTNFAKLKPDWKFYHIGWQNRDREHKTLEGYYMLPTGRMEYGFDIVFEYLMKYKPDFFLTLCDVGWQSGIIEGVKKAKQSGWKGRWVAYTPIDTDSWTMTWKEIFDMPDLNIAMSKYGEERMLANGVPNVRRIEHGVDTKIYKPLNNVEELKAKYGLAGKFVIGFVGRNQIRKMIDRLLLGFKEFSKDKPDVVLLLHTDLEPPQQGWSLKYLQWLYGIQDKLKLTKGDLDINSRQRIQPQNMNEIYNLMDIFGYATGGEGFGLPALECQSAGIPLLMTNCTTALDLCEEDNKIPILKDAYGRDSVVTGTNGVNFVVPDDIGMAKLFEERYKEWKEKREDFDKRKDRARRFSLAYDWSLISKQWIDLFERESE